MILRRFSIFSLDRTNFVQDILSRTALEDFLLQIRRDWMGSVSLWGHHRELWAENGDALSKIYAGTGALNTSFTRSGKRTLAGENPIVLFFVNCWILFDRCVKVYFRMPRKAYPVPISTTSKIKANKLLSICSW